MNWFERYGIVGTYFWGITFVFLWIFDCNSILEFINKKENFPALIAFFVSSFPIGYLWCVISQYLYYKGCYGNHVHKKILERYEIRFPCVDNNDESILESHMSALIRLGILERTADFGTEKLKHIDIFIRRRFDVIAINNAIITTTLFSFIITGSFFVWENFFINTNWISYWEWESFFGYRDIGNILVISFIILIMVVLFKVNRIFENQFIDIHRFYWKNTKIVCDLSDKQE